MADVQSAIKHIKIYENSKFEKKIENIILELPFGIGFIRIRKQARFFTAD